MRKIIFFILLLTPGVMQAQHTWKPWGVSEAGLITGSNGLSGDLRLQGGMKYGGWLLGAGVAHDGYRMVSIPVYAQVRKMFGNKHIKPFLTGSFGINYETEQDGKTNMYLSLSSNITRIMAAPSYSYHAGSYADLGGGLAFRTHKKFGFNLSLGYSRKTVREEVNQLIYDGSGNAETVSNATRYVMNRYVFRIGMQL